MYLTIKNWKLENKEEYMDWTMTAKDWRYIIMEEKTKRSTPQNRYLRWWVYKEIGKHMGEPDMEYIHWVMGMKFLQDHSKKMPYVRSTTTLSTAEFTEYIENIKNFVAEYGIIIPSSEVYFTNNE